MFLLFGTILLITSYKLSKWNTTSGRKNFKDRPLIYSTKPLFGAFVKVAPFVMLVISFALFRKANYSIENLSIFIALCILYLILGLIFRFLKYLLFEKRCKNEVGLYLHDGLLLPNAIAQTFSNLNKDERIGLSESTINRISFGISELIKKMDTENVIDIYASFIYLYVFSDGRNMNAVNITDEKLTNHFLALDLLQENGYYVIKHNKKNKGDE